MNTRITLLDHNNPPAWFAGITTFYTDLDGSFFAPGGTALTNNAGTPSTTGVECMVALRKAGVEVVIATGRNRPQCTEISRVLDVNTFIGELGGFTSYTLGDPHGNTTKHQLTFHKGDWAALPEGTTPAAVLEKSGVIDRLCSLYPGRMVRLPMTSLRKREVTVLMLGNVDVAEAAAAVSTPEQPVHIIDNGEVNVAPDLISLDDGVHIYHVLPAGMDKGVAVAQDIHDRGIDRGCTLAIGDSCGDIPMARACEGFVLVGNGYESDVVRADVERQGIDILTVRQHTIDGWVECARAILAAKGCPLP